MEDDLESVAAKENRADHLIWQPVVEWKRQTIYRLLNRQVGAVIDGPDEILTYVEQNFPCNAGTVEPAVNNLLYDLRRVGAISTGATVTILRSLRG